MSSSPAEALLYTAAVEARPPVCACRTRPNELDPVLWMSPPTSSFGFVPPLHNGTDAVTKPVDADTAAPPLLIVIVPPSTCQAPPQASVVPARLVPAGWLKPSTTA